MFGYFYRSLSIEVILCVISSQTVIILIPLMFTFQSKPSRTARKPISPTVSGKPFLTGKTWISGTTRSSGETHQSRESSFTCRLDRTFLLIRTAQVRNGPVSGSCPPYPFFPAFRVFQEWFPGLAVQGVPSDLFLRFHQGTPGFLSFQRGPGILDLLAHLFDRDYLTKAEGGDENGLDRAQLPGI